MAIITLSELHADRVREALLGEVRRNPALSSFFDPAAHEPVVIADLSAVAGLSRDAVVMSLPFRPLCQPDCRGLCSECGVRLSDPGNEDHHHESIDPRWKALQGLPALGEEGEGSDAEETDR